MTDERGLELEPATEGEPAGRPVVARLARLHLRGGLLGLARAELETLAGRGELDLTSLADLAEVRWRTGDLHGGGQAARAHLDGGGREAVASVVAAEAEAASGRLHDARDLAARLVGRPDLSADQLEALLGGRARAPIWPPAATWPDGAGPSTPTMTPPLPPPRPPGPGADAVTETSTELELTPEVIAAQAGGTTEVEEAMAIAEAAVDAADATVGARLALLLRDRSAPAPLVVELADRALARGAASGGEGHGPAVVAALQLVRGDAYRQMGRELEAAAAYQACRAALAASASQEAADDEARGRGGRGSSS